MIAGGPCASITLTSTPRWGSSPLSAYSRTSSHDENSANSSCSVGLAGLEVERGAGDGEEVVAAAHEADLHTLVERGEELGDGGAIGPAQHGVRSRHGRRRRASRGRADR